jgi:hypothetical protein
MAKDWQQQKQQQHRACLHFVDCCVIIVYINA